MRLHLFPTRESRLRVRRETVVRRLDAVQAAVVASVTALSETEWRREHRGAGIAPGALAQHIAEELGRLSDLLQEASAGGRTPSSPSAAWSAPAADHLALAVRNILDRQGGRKLQTAPLIDVLEAVVTHLEGHAHSLAIFAPH